MRSIITLATLAISASCSAAPTNTGGWINFYNQEDDYFPGEVSSRYYYYLEENNTSMEDNLIYIWIKIDNLEEAAERYASRYEGAISDQITKYKVSINCTTNEMTYISGIELSRNDEIFNNMIYNGNNGPFINGNRIIINPDNIYYSLVNILCRSRSQ